MKVVNIDNVKESTTPHGKSVKWLLSKEMGTPNFEMRYFECHKESKGIMEKHSFEHEVFVLKGRGIVENGKTSRELKPGDAILVFPNELHQFYNVEEEPFSFICVIPNGCDDHLKKNRSSVQR